MLEGYAVGGYDEVVVSDCIGGSDCLDRVESAVELLLLFADSLVGCGTGNQGDESYCESQESVHWNGLFCGCFAKVEQKTHRIG